MDRHISFERLHNFRDLGGYPTADGRTVRWRRLFRSDSLGKLRGADWDRFLELRIGTVIDLRHPWEVEAYGRIPDHDGLVYHNLSIEHRTYEQAGLDPDTEVVRYLADRYAEVAADGVREIRDVLGVIAAGDAPAVLHCASGKDRTGLMAALILTLLGVAEADVVADFERTELARDLFLADWRTEHDGAEPRWPGFARTPPELVRIVLAELAEQHGSVHAYATLGLGVDDPLIQTLRNRLLTA